MWQDTFASVLLSDEQKALDIKRENIPTTLYRYRSVKTGVSFARLVKTLCSGQLYCVTRDMLNDPFELRSTLSSRKASAYFGNDKTKQSAIFDHLKNHFDVEEFSKAMSGDDWFDKLMRLVFENSPSTDGLSMEFVETSLNSVIMKQIEDVVAGYESIFNVNRIASFSETCKNLPMWHHYTDEHQGVCLMYDTSELSVFDLNHLFPVIYAQELPDVVKFAFEVLDSKTPPPTGLATFYCIHKLIDWSYEKEWRYVYQPRLRYGRHEDIPPDYWGNGVEIDFIKPLKIILGAKMEQDVKSELCNIAFTQGIAITQMKVTPYGLEEIEVLEGQNNG